MITGSKKILLDLIKRQGTLSMEEAVVKTSLAKTTLREHLLQLERDGYISREFIRSGPGRPKLTYELTHQGHALYPSYESEMMREFLVFLQDRGDEELIEAFFQSFWDKRFVQALERMERKGGGDLSEQMDALARMLEREGFMPEYEVEPDEDRVILRECNCPFREIVRETRLPCELEMSFYRRLFGREVVRTEYIAEGGNSCTYCIEPDSTPLERNRSN